MNKLNEVNFFKTKRIQSADLSGAVSINSADTKIKSFKDTICDLVSEMNEVTKKPEKLTTDFVQGKADIHDVMAAIAQSELTVQAATTVTGKILQTYEKIMQIQI